MEEKNTCNWMGMCLMFYSPQQMLVVVLTNIKTMIMNFISKTLNPTSTATPSNPNFALKQQQAFVVESPLGS
jgi:hypothetical protein